jgi:hypothetical protein
VRDHARYQRSHLRHHLAQSPGIAWLCFPLDAPHLKLSARFRTFVTRRYLTLQTLLTTTSSSRSLSPVSGRHLLHTGRTWRPY